MPVAKGYTLNGLCRRERWLLVGGLVLLVLFAVVMGLLETGPFEFAYAAFQVEPLPFAAMRGFTFEQLYAHVARLLLAAPALLMVSFALARVVAVAPPGPAGLRRLALGCALASLGMIATVMFGVLQGRAIVDDELAYRAQARLLSEGRLGADDLPRMPEQPFVIKTASGYTGKYLFGEPLIQVPGVLLGVPALMHLPLAALTLLFLFLSVRWVADDMLACWAVVLVALSPMFIITTATAQSQAGSLFCVSVLGLSHAAVRRDRLWLGAVLLAMGLGFGATVRVQAMTPVGAVFGVVVAYELVRRRGWLPGIAALCLLGGWLALIGLYNHALTRSYTRLPWFLSAVAESYGFGSVWEGASYRHTPLRALENLAVVAVRFNGWWLGWPASLLLLWYWFKCGRPKVGLTIWLWAGLALLLFEAGYHSTGVSDTGPIYHYELLIPAALLGANAIRRGFDSTPRFAAVALGIHFIVGTGGFLWAETSRLARLSGYIHDDANAVVAQLQRPALLIYEDHCSESLVHGWLFSRFPRRNWSDRDAVVTFPRPDPRHLAQLKRRFSGRSCYYWRRHPRTLDGELYRCDESPAPQLLQRSKAMKRLCVWVKPTAARLGLYDPFGGGAKSTQADRDGLATTPK